MKNSMKLVSGRSSGERRQNTVQNATPQNPAERTAPKSYEEILADISPDLFANIAMPPTVPQNVLRATASAAVPGYHGQTSATGTLPQRPVQRPAQRPVPAATASEPAQARAPQIYAGEAQKKSKRSKSERKDMSRKAIFIIFTLIFLAVAACALWYYWWTSYAIFEYRLQPVVILEGQSFSPDEFLDTTEEMGDISAVLQNPRFTASAGRIIVPLTLRNGLRSLDTTAELYVLRPVDRITIELAEESPPINPMHLITNAEITRGIPFDVRFTEEPLLLEDYPVGEFTLYLTLNGAPFEVILTVTDTTPPTATAANVVIRIGEPVTPYDFVADVSDASRITSVSFVNEPDVFATRDQIVEIIIEDEFGNSILISSSLSILLNREPPTIEGTVDIIESLVGNPIIYRQGVTAFDDFGRELEVRVDSSGVDQHTEGEYTVIFRAEDLTGLYTEIEVAVLIIEIDTDYVDQRVDAILENILTDGMTQVEQVRVIFRWVRSNVQFAPVRGGPQSVYEGAYRALYDRRGNCYIFYSISERLLTRAGIPNMRIQRDVSVPGTTHLWNLINPDGLGWYHYDSLPTRASLGFSPLMYMFTASQAAEWAAMMNTPELHGAPTYFTYDASLYPEIVQE
jgi:hypothetical protein